MDLPKRIVGQAIMVSQATFCQRDFELGPQKGLDFGNDGGDFVLHGVQLLPSVAFAQALRRESVTSHHKPSTISTKGASTGNKASRMTVGMKTISAANKKPSP